MATTKFQPPPTYAMPVIEDQRSKTLVFNPIWLKWFLDLSQNLGTTGAGSGSGSISSITAGPGLAGGTIVTSGTISLITPVAVSRGGTGRVTGDSAYGLVTTGTSATSAQQTVPPGLTTQLLVGGGVAALPVWTVATGSGAPVRATSPTTAGLVNTGNLTLSKTSGEGILVDPAAPTYGWRDILGGIAVKGSGPTDPAWSAYQGTIKGYQFSVNDEVQIVFHLPHDHAPGTDLYLHAHWSVITTVIETVTWGFDITYAKGHQQAAFPATVTTTVAQASNGTAYFHNIAETVITGGALLNLASIEVDGLILVRVYLSANTGAIKPFLHTADIHYQSTNMATKQKAPNFYV